MTTLKPDVYHLIYEKARSSAEEKQVFISAYLQDLHIYLSAIPGLSIPGLNLIKEMEFDDSKICRNISEPLLHQHDNKQLCNCNRNFTISRVCIDLQHYQPINLAFKGEVITLTPEKLLEYGLVYQLICSDPSQVSNLQIDKPYETSPQPSYSLTNAYPRLTTAQPAGLALLGTLLPILG